SEIGRECVARYLGLRKGARRENVRHGSLTDEQRSRSGKDRQPSGAKLWRAACGVAPQSQNASAMLLRRALPATRQSLAHSFPIYEMGSSVFRHRDRLDNQLAFRLICHFWPEFS